MAAVPESIALIAGDAAHNVRSALDHFCLGRHLARNARKTDILPGLEQFVSAYSSAQWQKQVSQQMNGAGAELIKAVVKLEAWETGRDSLLWAIHELDRVDKHRLLLPVAVAFTAVGLDGDSYELTVVKKKYSGIRGRETIGT